MSDTTTTKPIAPMMVNGQVGPHGTAALNSTNQRNINQANANAAVGGSKKKKGGSTQISPLQTSYKSPGADGQTVNATNVNNHIISKQGATNSAGDHLATQQGGSRKKRGGNPDWLWGCYSGGKKKKMRTNKRKTRRYRKKTRRNKK
jgi:hypothetical protein